MTLAKSGYPVKVKMSGFYVNNLGGTAGEIRSRPFRLERDGSFLFYKKHEKGMLSYENNIKRWKRKRI